MGSVWQSVAVPSTGVFACVTVTDRLAGLAHWPTDGVKVSTKLPAPATDGVKTLPETPVPDQFPVTPLTLVGKLTAGSFVQNGPIGFGDGLVAVVMETFIVVGKAHCPTVGVKVAVMVLPPCPAGLMLLGFQVPLKPLLELVGKTTGAAFSQSGPTGVKVGVGAVVPFTTILSM